MEIQLHKPERENLSISFELSPFITAWATAETTFMASIARELGELLLVRPHDFYSNDSAGLGESRCTYRIFGGASTIVLSPGTLLLNFDNLTENDYPTVTEVVRRSRDILSRELGCYAKDHVSVNSNGHVPVVENGAADTYLAQFAWKEPTDTATADVEIEYRPAGKIIMSDKQNRWSLHRTVEKSAFLPEGLFVTTMILITSPRLTSFDEQKQLVERVLDLADRAAGLTYLGDSGNASVP